MEKDQNKFEQVLNRILTKAPCSIVLPPDMDAECFADSFINAYKEPLGKENILPVRVKCTRFPDALSIWKELSMKIKEAVPTVFEGDIITTRCFMSIEQATSTEVIKSYLIRILNQIEKKTGWMILVVMEDFENVVDKMEEHDIMKVRGITTFAVILTLTHVELLRLCEEKYGHAYFCNQFVTYRF